MARIHNELLPPIAPLVAHHTTYGWYVEDTSRMAWWPDDEARGQIEAADDPAAEAVRMCGEEPTRGAWCS